MDKREKCVTIAIKMLLKNYIKLVKQNLQDLVPKICVSYLIVQSMDKLYEKLVVCMFKPETIDKLMQEANEVQDRRNFLKKQLCIVDKSLEVLVQLRNYSLT